jgi:hypothetical protein
MDGLGAVYGLAHMYYEIGLKWRLLGDASQQLMNGEVSANS